MSRIKAKMSHAAVSAAVALSALSAGAYVFDDAKAWYRGAVDAEGNGVFTDGGGGGDATPTSCMRLMRLPQRMARRR